VESKSVGVRVAILLNNRTFVVVCCLLVNCGYFVLPQCVALKMVEIMLLCGVSKREIFRTKEPFE
jgi:hypothetical protein